MYINKAKGKRW